MNDDFVDLLRVLLAEDACFLVVGAHAMAVHGVGLPKPLAFMEKGTMRASHRKALLLLGMTLVAVASASGVREIPIEIQARDADLVVVGVYSGEFTSSEDPVTHLPYMDQVVTVLSCLNLKQGSDGQESTCPAEVIIRALGGITAARDPEGNIRYDEHGEPIMRQVDETDGMPWLSRGEHLLFLKQHGAGNGFRLFGSRKGMRRVMTMADGSKAVVLPFNDWSNLSDEAKASRQNAQIKLARDRAPGTDSAPRRGAMLPEGLYYTDTVRLTDLPSLFDRMQDRGRPQPQGR